MKQTTVVTIVLCILSVASVLRASAQRGVDTSSYHAAHLASDDWWRVVINPELKAGQAAIWMERDTVDLRLVGYGKVPISRFREILFHDIGHSDTLAAISEYERERVEGDPNPAIEYWDVHDARHSYNGFIAALDTAVAKYQARQKRK